MKKKIAVFFLLMIFSTLTVFAGAVEAHRKYFTPPTNIDYTAEIVLEGKKQIMFSKFIREKNNMLATVVLPPYSARVLIKKGIGYLIDDTNKVVIRLPRDKALKRLPTVDLSGYKAIGKGKGKVNGKTYPYEEFLIDSQPIKVYYEGDRLVAFESFDRQKVLFVIRNYSTIVPKGVFDLPKGYKKVTVKVSN